MFLVILLLGLELVLTGVNVRGESSEEETPSKATKGFLKSRTASRHLSFSSSFGSEDFDSPDIPSDFHARYGINKTWGKPTPYPVLSVRQSYEDYGGHIGVTDSTEGEIDTSELFSKTAVSKKKMRSTSNIMRAHEQQNKSSLKPQSNFKPNTGKAILQTAKSKVMGTSSQIIGTETKLLEKTKRLFDKIPHKKKRNIKKAIKLKNIESKPTTFDSVLNQHDNKTLKRPAQSRYINLNKQTTSSLYDYSQIPQTQANSIPQETCTTVLDHDSISTTQINAGDTVEKCSFWTSIFHRKATQSKVTDSPLITNTLTYEENEKASSKVIPTPLQTAINTQTSVEFIKSSKTISCTTLQPLTNLSSQLLDQLPSQTVLKSSSQVEITPKSGAIDALQFQRNIPFQTLKNTQSQTSSNSIPLSAKHTLSQLINNSSSKVVTYATQSAIHVQLKQETVTLSQPVTNLPSQSLNYISSQHVPNLSSIPEKIIVSQPGTIIPSKPMRNTPSQPVTNLPSQTVTNKPSQTVTNLPSQTVTNKPSQPVTNLPSQTVTNKPSQPVTNLPTQTVTNKPSQPVTKLPSKTVTTVPSQPVTITLPQPATNVPPKSVSNTPSQTVTNVPSQIITNTPSKPVANVPSQIITNVPSQIITNVPPQPITNIPSQIIINTPSQPVTNIPSPIITKTPSQPITIAPSQIITNTPSRPATNIQSQPITNVPSQIITKTSSQPVTIIPSHIITKVPSQPITNVPSQMITNVPPQPVTNIPSPIKTETPSPIITETPSQAIVSQAITNTPSQFITNTPSQPATNIPSQIITKTPSQPATNIQSQIITTVPSQPKTIVPSQIITNTQSQPVTNVQSKITTNTPSQPVTNVPSQIITDTPSQPVTNTLSKIITNTPPQPVTRLVSQIITNTPSQPLTNVPSQIITDTPSASQIITDTPSASQIITDTPAETLTKTSSQPLSKPCNNDVSFHYTTLSPSRPTQLVQVSPLETTQITTSASVTSNAVSTKKASLRPYDKILNKAGELIRPKTTKGPTGTTSPKVSSTQLVQVTSRRPSMNGKEKREVATPPTDLSDQGQPSTSSLTANVQEASPRPHFSSPTAVTPRFKTRAWGPALPKMVPALCVLFLVAGSVFLAIGHTLAIQDKYKRRRITTTKGVRVCGQRAADGTGGRDIGDVIVLKPPPEDWPAPQGPGGAQPVFGEAIPPMGTHIDTRIGHKGKDLAAQFEAPSFLGHRKIDFVPPYDKTTAATVGVEGVLRQSMDTDSVGMTTAAAVKWRIRGRVRGWRPAGDPAWGLRGRTFMTSGVQEPANIRRSLTMKPSISKYFIAENSTFQNPTPPASRPYHRSYFNFRKRPPGNVGRSFGSPFEQGPPPPPRFMPYPQFPQGYPHPFGPPPPPPPQFGPPPYGPPPPPPFGQGLSPHFQGAHLPPPPPPAPPHQFSPPLPQPPRPPPPPSPYPTGFNLPSVRPFLENIPTVSPIDSGPAPWPRRPINWDYRRQAVAQPRVPDFLKNEPRNFSGYKGPRRGRGYEQYGKADLRPRPLKFHDEYAVKAKPNFPSRKGSGFGVVFQTNITRPPYRPGEMFVKRTWPTRANKYGYEPYRRTSDRRRPYGGFHRYAAEHPPVLGDFNDFKPYKRMDETNYVPFNYSRPTRSYTFPPRLSIAIRNATMQRRYGQRSYFRQRDFNLPTLPSIGLEAYMAQKFDYWGNLITPKGRIMNLQDLKKLFTPAPMEVVTIDVSEVTHSAIKPRLTPKPKGMTAREAMRAAAREAIREAELEDWEEGKTSRRRKGWRGVGGTGGRGGEVVRRGGARGSGRRPRGPMNFRRAKRSLEDEAALIKKRETFRREMYDSGDYLTGPGAKSSTSSKASKEGPRSRPEEPPLRMRYRHTLRAKGRPVRWARQG